MSILNKIAIFYVQNKIPHCVNDRPNVGRSNKVAASTDTNSSILAAKYKNLQNDMLTFLFTLYIHSTT